MKTSHGRDLFKVNAVTAGCLVALLAAGAAQAQQTSLDTIVVTGIRRGIEASISVKKNSDSIVESISAEDIGKLPDVSVAESIARLPGVSAQRTAGRAQQVNVRGFAGDFATALLNGREQVTTGDSRGVEFDQYPAELLAGVDLYKTPDASLVGQGLSATINLKTVRPLDFGKRVLAANARKQRTGVGIPNGEGEGDRVSFAYIDQFADRTLGVSLGYARFTEDGAQTQRFDAWGGWTPDVAYQGANVRTPGGFGRWVDKTQQTRDGMTATVQFKPSKDFESTLDLYFSKFNINTRNTGLQGAVGGLSAGGYDPSGVLSNATITNGVASAGTIDGFKGVVRNDVQDFKDKLKSIGWNNKLSLGDWKGVLDLSRSEATRKGEILETTAGQAGNTPAASTDRISWTGFNGSNFGDVQYRTGLNYTDRAVAKLTDVMGWGGGVATPQAGYSKLPDVKDELSAVRLAAKTSLKDMWLLSEMELGLNVTDRSKKRNFVEGRLEIVGNNPFGTVDMPGSGVTDIGGGLSVASFDPTGSIGSIYRVVSKFERNIANKTWTVDEKVTTGYVKFDVDGELLGLPVRGNVGTQLVMTDQSSTAFNTDGSPCPADVCNVTRVTDGKKYNDLLPAMNLVFDLGSDQVVRFGLGKQIARATMSDMRASIGFGVDTGNTRTSADGRIKAGAVLNGDAGNPTLKPFKATALDVSYEKYFGTKAYVSVAGFHKKLDTYILSVSDTFDFSPYITAATPLPASGANQGSKIGFLNQKINGSGGNVKGVEVAVNLPFNLVTDWLDGFGAYLSHANTSSSITLPTNGFRVSDIATSSIPLPGLSKKVTNLAVYYEQYGFSVRYGQRKRSDFVGDVSDIFGDRNLTYVKGETVADVQVGYEFQTGPLKGLSILGQALNIGNEPFVRYRDTPSNEVENVKYGKTYLLGINYKL